MILGSLGLSLLIALSVFNWLPIDATNNSDSKTVSAGKTKQLDISMRTNGLNRVDRANLTNSVGKSNYSQHDIANAVANKKPMSIDDILSLDGNAEPGLETNAENKNPLNVEANGVQMDKKLGNNALANLVPAPIGEVIPDAELDWKLSITFDENGVGSIKLNENEISKTLIQDNAKFLLLDVASEINRRCSFLEPLLDKQLEGVINVGEASFYFNDAKKLPESHRTHLLTDQQS